MTSEISTASSKDKTHGLAMINYGLLFAAIFFAGVPALVAVIIAYAQRDETVPLLRSHYDFQIRIFWGAFVLTLAAGVCFLGAIVNGVAELFMFTRTWGWSEFDSLQIDLSPLTIDRTIIGLVAASLFLTFLGALWLVTAPAYGLIRLASDRGIGQHARL